jgi:catechol 2,3-dioxygenase-like lactoylglutathione lyase family enzyme
LTVSDLARSRAFYERALAPLGYGVQMEWEGYVGFGGPRKPSFWMKAGPMPQSPMHIAFVAADRPKVDAFYAAALAAGGRDDGPPGPRPHYHPHYYGAFVLDPDGHPVEAVCHLDPAAKPAAKKTVAKKPAKKRAAKKTPSKKKPAAKSKKSKKSKGKKR